MRGSGHAFVVGRRTVAQSAALFQGFASVEDGDAVGGVFHQRAKASWLRRSLHDH
jgi:hypothetical protein